MILKLDKVQFADQLVLFGQQVGVSRIGSDEVSGGFYCSFDPELRCVRVQRAAHEASGRVEIDIIVPVERVAWMKPAPKQSLAKKDTSAA